MEGLADGTVPYAKLGALADLLLEKCDEDAAALAQELDGLTAPEREGLLSSDFFNAYQVFYYFFRTEPDEMERDRLLFLPASELQYGIRINEIELCELIFAVVGKEPVILVSDGDRILARFTGRDAYSSGLSFIESTL
jgi:hypothetical protein